MRQRILGLSIVLIGLLSIAIIMVRPTEKVTATTVNRTYSVETLPVKYNKKNLYGKLYVPKQAARQPRPTVILSHGLTGTYEDTIPYARALAKQGYVAYVFDFSGGSDSSRSSGKTTDMSIFTEASDLKAVISQIRKRAEVDKQNLFLAGESQGGAVSAIAGAQKTKQIKGLLLLYPAFSIPDEARQRFSSVKEIPKTVDNYMTVGRAYYTHLLNYNMWTHIQNFEGNVLLIHGSADDVVPIRYSKRAQKVFKHSTLKIIEGAGHGFYGADERQATKYMLGYMATNTK
ncbi:alpha/beta hydrolase [Agrilactobacillus yilanensis]|uniref:Alpha/beta hydrolase n=1 Tax=Agrilactobacillus yilanensis TaxID=2485997 RepID=A0ABW4J6E8_9LACO|nr:alpha/beta fold hydrolase [Agrilactobacillus yilanensis]